MKIIRTKIHGVLDYITGLILIASPWLMGFDDGGLFAGQANPYTLVYQKSIIC